MQEEELYHWWQYYARSGKTIYSQGRRLRVLYSGKLNTSRGPDFISTRFELDGIIYQGDVECHCKTSDWYAHQHHLDKIYRQVILHLVGLPEGLAPVKSQWSQHPITTIVLPKPLITISDAPERYCKPNQRYNIELKSNLIELALVCFEQKVNRFSKALYRQNFQELFYIHFFRALGYPTNANTFQLLAEQLSWTWLMKHKITLSADYWKLFAIYAGMAGFISPEYRDAYTQNIAHLYDFYKYLLPGITIDMDAWQYAGVRPQNHPHFRLAMGLQILYYYNYSLFDKLISILQKRQDYLPTLKDISVLLQLKPDTYWQTHYALGVERKGSRTVISMGKARIIELLINVILPLAAVQEILSGSEGFIAYIQSFYISLPLISPYGCFTKQTNWHHKCYKIWPRQAVNQSLLLLQSEYCQLLLCNQCPIKRHKGQISRKNIDNKNKNF